MKQGTANEMWLIAFAIAYLVCLSQYPHDTLRAMIAGVAATLLYFVLRGIVESLYRDF